MACRVALSFIVDAVALVARCRLGSGGPAGSPVCPVSLGGDWLLFSVNKVGSPLTVLGRGSFRGRATGFLSFLSVQWSFPWALVSAMVAVNMSVC